MESNLSSQHSGQDSCTEGAGQPTRLLDQGGKSVLIAGVESCGAAARGWPTASAVGLGIENLSAKRRKKVLLDPTLSPLTGLFARAHGSPRLTPWATIFRHSVADISSCGCPNSDLPQVRQRLLSVDAPRLLKSPVSSSRNSCRAAPWFETPFGSENGFVAAEQKSACHGDCAHHGASLGTPLANWSSSFTSFFNR